LREGKTYYRWCFSDLATAREFMEQFGGGARRNRTAKSLTREQGRRTAANTAKLPELLRST
jgi:hypothetical protein